MIIFLSQNFLEKILIFILIFNTTMKKGNMVTESNKFQPGEQSTLVFGREILNDNISWHEVVKDILSSKKYDSIQLAKRSGLSHQQIINLQQDEVNQLSFRQGAILLRMHMELFPEQFD